MMASRRDRLALTEPDETLRFESILGGAIAPAEVAEAPPFFRDLNLDQIVAAVARRRRDYDLAPYFHAALVSSDAIEFRHEVFRDLEHDELRAVVAGFATRLWRVRAYLGLAEKQHYELERQHWFLDAAREYCEGVTALADALAEHEPQSRGLRGLREFAALLSRSSEFAALLANVRQVADALARIRYSVRIKGRRVSVGDAGERPDYTQEVERIFERFRHDRDVDHLALPPDSGSMSAVEAEIAQLVARRHPDEFALLVAFCRDHQSFVDPTLARFEREIQFYLAWQEHMTELSASGLPFCYPIVSGTPKRAQARDAYDLALATKLAAEDTEIVLNDFDLNGEERIIVVTGPNQGGKTTFARMFGQLHHLARLGVPVPAAEAQLYLADDLFTHFEREEDVGALHGKLDDELLRVKEILDRASGDSVVLLNEIFASTTLGDAVLLGSEVLKRLVERGCLGVCVTFVDELASLGEATVSMVAEVERKNPSKRTFRVVRRPADGRAYAFAVADKYGLSYERVKRRVRP